MSRQPPAVSFVAPSGTGKTTLLESLLRELAGRGYRVGVVKHCGHGFEIDRDGTDSWRLSRAGASPLVLSSPEMLALVDAGRRPAPPLEEILARYMSDADLVLVEGYKAGSLPKIEVHRAALGGPLLCLDENGVPRDGTLIAVVSDENFPLTVPLFALDDAGGICTFLEKRLLDRDPPGG